MSRINELLEEIENINKKSEELNSNYLKKKLQNEYKIKELEEEKMKLGLRGQRMAVQNLSSKISRLKEEIERDTYKDFSLDIKRCKSEINDIINDYYLKGHDIYTIFVMEDIPYQYQQEWLGKSNFGEGTGFLYVNKIREEGNYWKYYNPFLEVEIKTNTLSNLIDELKYKNINLIKFDDELARDSENRDMDLFSIINDDLIDKLENLLRYYDIKITLRQLLNSEIQMTEKQVKRLCELSINKKEIYKCDSCKFYLKEILLEYGQFIDDDLYVKVIEKNELFYEELAKDSENRDINLFNRINDERIDELEYLQWYPDVKNALGRLAYSEIPMTEEQVKRLCHLSINRKQIYQCYICDDYLKKILWDYEDIIDDDLFKEVVAKNNLNISKNN